MVEDKVVGTYWYVLNAEKRWITQGNKPIRSDSGGFIRSGDGMGWLCLDGSDYAYKDKDVVTNLDYKDVNFPSIEPDTPIEIEIVKSGRVYVYES